MSDKKILKESTIRKMMKLAAIPALTDRFIQENYYNYNEQEELEAEEEVEMDAPMEEPPVDDMEMDAEMEIEEPAGGGLPEAEELVQDLMSVISDHFPEVDVNVEAEGGEEEVEMDAEVDLEEPMPEEPMDDMGGEEEIEMDAEVEEEEPMMEAGLEEEESFGAGIATAAEKESEVTADKAFMEEEEYQGDIDAVEVVEEDPAHNALIDAIAAKVAERLLAEAKKTNK